MILLTCLVTAIVSGMIGYDGDRFARGHVMALYGLYCCGVMLWQGVAFMYAPLGLIVAAVYFFLYRSGTQAHAELNAMDTLAGHDPDEFADVAWAYVPPVLISSLLIAGGYGYAGQWASLWFLPLLWVSIGAPVLAVWVSNYSSWLGKRLGWNHGRFWDARRFTEVCAGALPSGLAAGLSMQAITIALESIA
jgi:hypothetical protein